MLSETSEALGDKTAENGELATHQSPRAALELTAWITFCILMACKVPCPDQDHERALASLATCPRLAEPNSPSADQPGEHLTPS